MSGGGDWAEDIQDFLQAGDLNPNGIVLGLGAALPPPLDTYLIAGIVYYSAGNTYGYTGIRFNGTQYITETGLVTSANVIVPISYMAGVVFPGRPAIRFTQDVAMLGGHYLMADSAQTTHMDWDFTNTPGTIDLYNTYIQMRGGAVIAKDNGGAGAFVPTITGSGAFALGNSTYGGSYYVLGSICVATLSLTFGSTANQGAGGWTFGGYPAMYSAGSGLSTTPVGRWWYVKPASTQRASGDILMAEGATTFICQAGGSLPTLGAITTVGAAIPEAWASGAQLKCQLTYEVQTPE